MAEAIVIIDKISILAQFYSFAIGKFWKAFNR